LRKMLLEMELGGIKKMQSKLVQLEEKRLIYARRIAALAQIEAESEIGRSITAAFETVPREKFVGSPPWRIISSEGQFEGMSEDPADVYQDMLVALNAGKGLNNGQPSLHAFCMNALAPRKGDRAIHVGAGTGYYTAILAQLVGEHGRVDAYEIEPELAHEAAANLADYSAVQTHCRSGAEAPLPDCDVLYVSAACAEPLEVWLDALVPGGRLLFPLEPEGLAGRMLLVTKKSDQTYLARFLCAVQFVPCIGAQNSNAARVLDSSFNKGNWEAVRSLHRDDRPDETCWCSGPGWWLSTR
jgi:protein-L-isoaspartate(D-aspartate) O-methyltransferase